MKGFRLTKEKIAAWAGMSADAADITIDSMSTAEFIGKVEDLNKDYDMIYVGACIDYLNTEGSGSSRHTAYNDTRMTTGVMRDYYYTTMVVSIRHCGIVPS